MKPYPLVSIQSYKVKGDYCPKRWMHVLVRVGNLKEKGLIWPTFTAYLLLKATLSALIGWRDQRCVEVERSSLPLCCSYTSIFQGSVFTL